MKTFEKKLGCEMPPFVCVTGFLSESTITDFTDKVWNLNGFRFLGGRYAIMNLESTGNGTWDVIKVNLLEKPIE